MLSISCVEHKGRTIHLLKQSSKPVPQERKRRKISLFGTFEQFKQAQEEQKQEESEAEMAMPMQREQLDQVQDKSGDPPQVTFGLPNIIANAEDMDKMQSADAQQISSIDPHENEGDHVMAED